MHRRNWAIVFLIIITATSWSQDIQPEDPGIVLPPVLLEVEDLQVEDVRAALPDDEDQLRPEVSIPLPEADELYLPEEAFDIPYPDQVGIALGSGQVSYGEYLDTPRSPIFSEGTIGVGGPVYVLGDISLYKLGAEPRFRLQFFHEKLDGYGFRDAGSGFFYSDDILDGTLSFESDVARLEIDASISESSLGMQRDLDDVTTDYDSVTIRSMSGRASAAYVPVDILQIDGGLATSNDAQILAAATPLLSTEFLVAPDVSATLDLSPFSLSLTAGYRFLTASVSDSSSEYSEHAVTSALIATLYLPADISIYLDGGIHWVSSDGAIRPNIIGGVEGRVGTNFQFKTEGGYGVRPVSYRDMWADSPLVAMGSGISSPYGAMWSGTIQFRPVRTFLMTTDVTFDYMYNAIDTTTATNATTGLFDVSQDQMTTLTTGLAIDWEMSPVFSLGLNWIGRFIDRQQHSPAQVASLIFGAEDPGERFGANLDAALEFNPGVEIPEIDLGGFYRLSDSVQFELDIRDMFAPVYEIGRYYWQPYIEPGLSVTLSTKISL